jgi:hypothetical protein
VDRVDASTGRVSQRRVRRRRMFCSDGGLAGGYILVNDGPVFARNSPRRSVVNSGLTDRGMMNASAVNESHVRSFR